MFFFSTEKVFYIESDDLADGTSESQDLTVSFGPTSSGSYTCTFKIWILKNLSMADALIDW